MAKTRTLREWLLEVGEKEAAALIKVTPATIRHWRVGRCSPRIDQMYLIQKYSKGAVTYATMIGAFVERKRVLSKLSK